MISDVNPDKIRVSVRSRLAFEIVLCMDLSLFTVSFIIVNND